jgi:uncharacterized repeat protein (TIGR03803 family)
MEVAVHRPTSLGRRVASIGIRLAFLISGLGVATSASAQSPFRLLHAFFPPNPGRPAAPLVQGTDGNFYGTTQNGGFADAGTVIKVTPGGTVTVIHNFFGGDGSGPVAQLLQASDGNFYGTTVNGGNFGLGVLFQVTPAGSLTVLHHFGNVSVSDGRNPQGALIQGTDGNLYGTTVNGGSFGNGTVFQTTTTGAPYTILRSLNNGAPAEGTQPGGLIQATDGKLYGLTSNGGSTGGGTIFSLTTGGTFATLRAFNNNTDGSGPPLGAGVIQATDGNLYGVLRAGGPNGGGTLFQITTTGTFTVLHPFTFGADGGNPQAGVIQASDGKLYGTTSSGGANGRGVLFQSTTTGTPFTALHSFGGTDDGFNARAVIQGSDLNLWGTTQDGGTGAPGTPLGGAGTIYKSSLDGSSYTVVDRFNAGPEGSRVRGPLIQLNDGNFYGLTTGGGNQDLGAVIKMTPSGAVSTLHSLTILEGTNPQGPLTLGADGNLYGTTQFGGNFGSGAAFKVTTGGTLTVIHSFNFGTEGGNPSNGLTLASDGNFYGTTRNGGPSGSGGTVFRLTPAGAVTVLHQFQPFSAGNDGTDGINPVGLLVQAADGLLYGATQNGGPGNSGTIYRFSTSGGGYAVIHEFNNDGLDGASPQAGLIQATDGSLYGTTFNGGVFGQGTAYRLSTSGIVTIIHDFNCSTEGCNSAAALTQASDGNFYGTTQFGGRAGTVFRLTPAGVLTVLYPFLANTDGTNPTGAVVEGADGNLYGVTPGSGQFGVGTVFRISMAPNVAVRGDADSDGKADAILFRPSAGGAGVFVARSSSTGNLLGSITVGSGVSTSDTPLLADFDGDGKPDPAVYRRSTGQWMISMSSTNYSAVFTYTWGWRQNDVPVPGDYDGDHKADIAVFRKSTGQWFILLSSSGNTRSVTYNWGSRGDIPVPGLDFDGDGKADLTVFRPSTGAWFIAFSSSGYTTNQTYTWGSRTDTLVPADYDGDGKPDLAIYRAGAWWILTSSSGYTASTVVNWGSPGDVPVPLDYDGDGKADVAVYRPSTGQFWIIPSAGGSNLIYNVGVNGDIPAAALAVSSVSSTTNDLTRGSDVDGDRKAELTVFRPSTGVWWIDKSSSGYTTSTATTWGGNGDIPTPGDYDGDGKSDLAVFRPSTGQWFVLQSSDGASNTYSIGVATDVPVPGDYDGDGRTDVAVWRPSTGEWIVLLSSKGFAGPPTVIGVLSGSKPVPGDYDGDGKTDPGTFSFGLWQALLSGSNYAASGAIQWGIGGDIPVPGDYDADGITDIAVFRPSTGVWYVLLSSTMNTQFFSTVWGGGADVAVPLDYDGDGKTDIAIFRPSSGTWYILKSSTGYTGYVTYVWGVSTDIPVMQRQ